MSKTKELSANLNLIIDILDKVFAKVDSYHINSTSYDEVNEQVDILVQYEFQSNDELEPGTYCDNFIVGIPDYVLNSKYFNIDVKNFIEVMSEIFDNEMTKLIYEY